MAHKIMRPGATTDLANQSRAGYNLNIGPTTLRSFTYPNNTDIGDVGIRFPGLLAPAGTISIPTANLVGWTDSGHITANCDIYLDKRVDASGNPNPLAFAASPADVVGRWNANHTTNYVDMTGTVTTTEAWKSPSLTTLFKELMILAGAVYANPSDPNDLVALSPTTKDIYNPTIIMRSRNQTYAELRLPSDVNSSDPLKKYKLPSLDISIVLEEEPQIPSDRRTHIAILSDSYGWALQPNISDWPDDIADTYLTGYFAGQLYTTGLVKVHGPPAGFVSTFVGSQAYSIDDPYGQGGKGSIRPEGRSGFTKNGILKDRLMQSFGVASSDIVIHPFGLGGTTASNQSRTSGVWSNASVKGQPVVGLDTVDPTGDLSEVQNDLWRYVDSFGKSVLDILQDTSIERLLVIYIGGGNDFFSVAYQNGLLPMSRTPAAWDTLKSQIQSSYETIGRFCHEVRQAAVPSSPIEFIIAGYPNMQTDDPRMPEVKVNEGAPPGAGSFHRGEWPPDSNPDDWYGGPNGTNGYQAPLGSGSVNVIPHVPWFLQYSLPGAFTTPVSNVPGFETITGLPRAMEKTDLGMFLQIKAFSYCIYTWNTDYGNVYRDWYAHWAADHYGASFSPGFPESNTNRWNNAKGFFEFSYNAYPYSAAANNNLPYNNLKIAVSYGTRNIRNATVNAAMQYVIGNAAQAAIATLQGEGVACQYVEMWDSLGAEVGSGSTASAGFWAFLDGVHLTKEGSIAYVDELINRARPNSQILQTLTDWSAESVSRFMTFFDDTW